MGTAWKQLWVWLVVEVIIEGHSRPLLFFPLHPFHADCAAYRGQRWNGGCGGQSISSCERREGPCVCLIGTATKQVWPTSNSISAMSSVSAATTPEGLMAVWLHDSEATLSHQDSRAKARAESRTIGLVRLVHPSHCSPLRRPLLALRDNAELNALICNWRVRRWVTGCPETHRKLLKQWNLPFVKPHFHFHYLKLFWRKYNIIGLWRKCTCVLSGNSAVSTRFGSRWRKEDFQPTLIVAPVYQKILPSPSFLQPPAKHSVFSAC